MLHVARKQERSRDFTPGISASSCPRYFAPRFPMSLLLKQRDSRDVAECSDGMSSITPSDVNSDCVTPKHTRRSDSARTMDAIDCAM